MISQTTRSLFVYGTLTAPEVMQTLVGRLPPCCPAVLEGYSRHPVINFVFPGIIPSSSLPASTDKSLPGQVSAVPGILFMELTDAEMEILDWFEDVEYTRTNVSVITEKEKQKQLVPTQVYVWTNPLEELDLTRPWDYEQFRKERLSQYLVETVRPCLDEFNKEKKNQK